MSEATDQATAAQAEAAARGLVGMGDFDPAAGIFEWYEGQPVGVVIGRNVRRIREEQVLTQHELAQLWQRHGLAWARSKVSALEAGNRPQVSVGELVVMAVALRVPLRELFAGPEFGRVSLTPSSAEVDGPALQDLFDGGSPDDLAVAVGSEAYALQRAYTEKMASREKPAQADVELAQRIGAHPREVLQVAVDIFDGRSLTEERDRRVERMGQMTHAERQAHRGHITRELSAQIEKVLAKRGAGK